MGRREGGRRGEHKDKWDSHFCFEYGVHHTTAYEYRELDFESARHLGEGEERKGAGMGSHMLREEQRLGGDSGRGMLRVSLVSLPSLAQRIVLSGNAWKGDRFPGFPPFFQAYDYRKISFVSMVGKRCTMQTACRTARRAPRDTSFRELCVLRCVRPRFLLAPLPPSSSSRGQSVPPSDLGMAAMRDIGADRGSNWMQKCELVWSLAQEMGGR